MNDIIHGFTYGYIHIFFNELVAMHYGITFSMKDACNVATF